MPRSGREPRHESVAALAPLVPHDAVFLNLDLRQSGFGDFNKSALPMEKYRFRVQRERWTVELSAQRRWRDPD